MKNLILLLLPAFFLFAAFMPAGNVIITGNVKNEKGDPISALVMAGKSTAQTNAAGNYSISLSEKVGTLIFSAPGYKTRNEKKMAVLKLIL